MDGRSPWHATKVTVGSNATREDFLRNGRARLRMGQCGSRFTTLPTFNPHAPKLSTTTHTVPHPSYNDDQSCWTHLNCARSLDGSGQLDWTQLHQISESEPLAAGDDMSGPWMGMWRVANG